MRGDPGGTRDTLKLFPKLPLDRVTSSSMYLLMGDSVGSGSAAADRTGLEMGGEGVAAAKCERSWLARQPHLASNPAWQCQPHPTHGVRVPMPLTKAGQGNQDPMSPTPQMTGFVPSSSFWLELASLYLPWLYRYPASGHGQ